jgi:hypothetical protein
VRKSERERERPGVGAGSLGSREVEGESDKAGAPIYLYRPVVNCLTLRFLPKASSLQDLMIKTCVASSQ